jgi:hypothetical protein
MKGFGDLWWGLVITDHGSIVEPTKELEPGERARPCGFHAFRPLDIVWRKKGRPI